jgi:hypothetical protein
MNVTRYPVNILQWFPDLEDKKFITWAFRCEMPRFGKCIMRRWKVCHPEYPLDDEDFLSDSICKMNYIYQTQYLKGSQGV